jgi:glucose-1-phosphate cytidylyltransferase
VLPNLSYHVVSLEPGSNLVSGVHPITNGSIRINGGYFIFKKEIFDYIEDQEELVLEPFQRLMQERQLIGYQHDGFWAGMDTFKDKQDLESLWAHGEAPWHVWKDNGNEANSLNAPGPVPVYEFHDRRDSRINRFAVPGAIRTK